MNRRGMRLGGNGHSHLHQTSSRPIAYPLGVAIDSFWVRADGHVVGGKGELRFVGYLPAAHPMPLRNN